jgi:hypothetical protein
MRYFHFVNMVHSPRLPILATEDEIAMFADAGSQGMEFLNRLLNEWPKEDEGRPILQRDTLRLAVDPTHFAALSFLAANHLLPAALLQPMVQVCGVIHHTRETEGLRPLGLFDDLLRPPCIATLVAWVKAVLRADVFIHNAWSTRHQEIVVNNLVAGRCLEFFRTVQ